MELSEKLGREFSGPIMFHYVWWVLTEAKNRGLRRLYFLARDGYTLLKIANLFCDTFHLPIECRYLYCSRASLRIPSYFFIGEDAFELLTLGGYYGTLKSLLLRGGLTRAERQEVYVECGMQHIDEDRALPLGEFERYAGLIRQSRTFRMCVVKKSKTAYADTIGYLKEEGLFEQNTVAVVDSGWTGSMQHSLRQLLAYSGFKGSLIGFYFGMYAKPKSSADGIYLTWYFDAANGAMKKALFCNNLFECLLSAPHGMTASYRKTGAGYEPVQLSSAEGRELTIIVEQSEIIYDYAAQRIQEVSFDEFDPRRLRRDTMRRIKRYMSSPTPAEAAYYGQFLFCDDSTEAYHLHLAGKDQTACLRSYSVFRRVWRKLTAYFIPREPERELLWPYGTTAFLSGWRKWWYRWNILIVEWLHFALKRNLRKS